MCILFISRIYATLDSCYSAQMTGMQEHMLLHTRQSSTQSDRYLCRINTVVSPDDGHILA